MKKENLHNATTDKWKKTSEYIKGLDTHKKWGKKATQYFNSTKNKALDSLHANTALEIIGYDPAGTPDIIREAWRNNK